MIQLDDFKVTRLRIDWRPPKVKTVEVDGLACDFDYQLARHPKDPRRYRMHLKIGIREEGKQQTEVGYLIDAHVMGFFSFPENVDEKQQAMMSRVNGLNILYSTFRGLLAGLLGNFPGGVLVLPTIDPRSVVADVEKKKAALRQTKENEKKNLAGEDRKAAANVTED